MKAYMTTPRILLYRSSPGSASEEWLEVASPVSCLHEAIQNPFDLIVISFDEKSLKERDALVELCTALRANRCTRDTALVCLMASRHRKLLERLQDAGVEFVMFHDSTDRALARRLEEFMTNRPEAYRIESSLFELCPYINYVPISRRQEILYCRAYRNRLVLGPHLLKLTCETLNHRDCPYYKAPKSPKNAANARPSQEDHSTESR